MGLVTFVFAVAAGALGGGAADARPASKTCGLRGAKTLVASKHARVVQNQGRVYACLYRSGRRFPRFFLGVRREGYLEVNNLRVAGRFVGYSRRVRGRWNPQVTVRELRRGRVLRRAAAAVASRPGFTDVSDLLLARTGAVAWIAVTAPLDVIMNPAHTPEDLLPDFEVGMAGRGGIALLDRGHHIAAGSLRLRGGAVTWVKAGRPYLARLE